jgi:2'-5' RNA ligase
MRLFVALMPPKEALSKMADAAAPLKDALGVKLLPPDNWHLTLKFIGYSDEAKEKEIAAALSSVEFPPFTVRLFGAGAYPSKDYPRAIWIGGESHGATELAGRIEDALEGVGIPREGKKFSTHITVARSKSAGDIEDFLKKNGAMEPAGVAPHEICSFEARSFSLVESKLLPQGSSYKVLREYVTKL